MLVGRSLRWLLVVDDMSGHVDWSGKYAASAAALFSSHSLSASISFRTESKKQRGITVFRQLYATHPRENDSMLT